MSDSPKAGIGPFGLIGAALAGAVLSAIGGYSGEQLVTSHLGLLSGLSGIFYGLFLGLIISGASYAFFGSRRGIPTGVFAALFCVPLLIFAGAVAYTYVEEWPWRNYSKRLDDARHKIASAPSGLEETAKEIVEGHASKETQLAFNEAMSDPKRKLSESTLQNLFRYEKSRGFQEPSLIRFQPLTQEMLRQVAEHSPPHTLALLILLERDDLPVELIESLTQSNDKQTAETAERELRKFKSRR
jgi:hypothetical protein